MPEFRSREVPNSAPSTHSTQPSTKEIASGQPPLQRIRRGREELVIRPARRIRLRPIAFGLVVRIVIDPDSTAFRLRQDPRFRSIVYIFVFDRAAQHSALHCANVRERKL